MNCPYHPSNEISTICIANHNCQRKYCPECQYEHGGEINQYLPIELFSKKLKKKSQAYNLDNDQEQVKQHREFKILFANTQTNLKKVFHDVNQSIQGINEAIKKQAQVYLNLINTQFSLSESSYSDLDLMVKILERNRLDKWRFSKQYYYNLFEQLKSALKFEIEKFIRMINSLFSDILQEEQIKKQEGLKQQGEILIKTNFDIHYSAQRQIKYIYQGETLWMYNQLLQSFNQYDILQQPQILKNLEQIKNLKWIGEVGKNMKKIGFWSSQWKGESSEGCGGEYTLDGNKRGKWKEMIKNYYDNSKVYEVGEYVNEFRSGIWKYIYNNQEIGGGEYIQSGQKNGQWIELSEEFSNKSQVTYNGEYKNDKKVGRWNTVAFGIQIGGGSYDEEGIEIKNGTWIELNTKFLEYSQIYYFGDYKNGQKVGKWSTWWNMANENKEIGGGSYDQGNNGMKMGKWIELSEDFQYLSQIIYQGEYLKGKKTGRWDILYRMITNENFTLIGGGLFDERGYGIKIGKWIEVNEGFGLNCVVTYNGEYENGKKVGRWSTIRDGLEIGGGSYDEKEKETKIGQWIELNDGFWEQSQVFYEGEYKNNKKVGKWEIFLNFEGAQKQIGYGSYDKEGIKIGKWVELNHRFQNCFQIFHVGHYKNGRKIGRWDIASLSQLIGGGTYDEQSDCAKVGEWIELSDEFQNSLKVLYNGQYNKGSKVGKWDISVCGKQIGGGNYEENGDGNKIGEWVELSKGFSSLQQVIYKGEYKNSKKIGRWNILYTKIDVMNQADSFSGGGSYDDNLKIGNWIELIDGFGLNGLVTLNGYYNNGKKVGNWMAFDCFKNEKLGDKFY